MGIELAIVQAQGNAHPLMVCEAMSVTGKDSGS